MSPNSAAMLVHEVGPCLKNTVPYSVPFVSSEDAEELLQDATAIAPRLLERAEANGKSVSAGNIAYYALLHTRSGRRFHSASRSDAMGSGTQIAGKSRVSSFDDPIGGVDETTNEALTLGDVLTSDAEDPSEAAARKMDWESFLATLDARSLAILRCLAEEVLLQLVADAHRVSRSTVQTWKEALPQAIRSFMGEDLLIRSQQAPAWKDALAANWERMFVRYQRQSA